MIGPVPPAALATRGRAGAAPDRSRAGNPVNRGTPWGLPEWFMIGQFIGPAILFLPGTQPFRVPFRVGVFALGLVGLVVARRSQAERPHPSTRLLGLAIAYVALMNFHPATNTLKAGLAQTLLDLAIVAPLFWAPSYFRGDPQRLTRALTILWVFSGASAAVGILQVRDPDRWMPRELSSVVTTSQHGVAGLSYQANGNHKVVRPPGLGDAPGAASGAGLLVASMGLAYLVLPVTNLRRVLGLVGLLIGVTVILLTHVRSTLVIFLGAALVLLILVGLQRRVGSALGLIAVVVGSGVLALSYAVALGGQQTFDRFATLVDADPLTVYDRSARLGMLTAAFDTTLVDYPLGGGLGRFGMMRGYFGDESNLDSPPIWIEVQIPGWIVEGGIVLLGLQLAAILVAFVRLCRIALRDQSPTTRQWAAAVTMLSAPPIALLFSYCPFYSQMGMLFWFLIGALEGVVQPPDSSLGPQSAALRGRKMPRAGCDLRP